MKSKKILLLAPALLMSGALASCNSGSKSVLSVTNLKSAYYVGDKLDASSLSVVSIDSQGKATAVDPANIKFSIGEFTSTGKQNVIVTDTKTNNKGAFTVDVLNTNEITSSTFNDIFKQIYFGDKVTLDLDINVKGYETNQKQTYQRNGNKESVKYVYGDNTVYDYRAYVNNVYRPIGFVIDENDKKVACYNSFIDTESGIYYDSLFEQLYINYFVFDGFDYFGNFKLEDGAYKYTKNFMIDYGYVKCEATGSYEISFNKGDLVNIKSTISLIPPFSEEKVETKYTITMKKESQELFEDPVQLDIHAIFADTSKKVSINEGFLKIPVGTFIPKKAILSESGGYNYEDVTDSKYYNAKNFNFEINYSILGQEDEQITNVVFEVDKDGNILIDLKKSEFPETTANYYMFLNVGTIQSNEFDFAIEYTI